MRSIDRKGSLITNNEQVSNFCFGNFGGGVGLCNSFNFAGELFYCLFRTDDQPGPARVDGDHDSKGQAGVDPNV